MSNWDQNQLARALLKAARKFYENPDNVKEYISWHVKKYGFPPTSGVGINPKEI